MNKTYFAILVAALGYFVDIYDLILFSIVRVPSLKSLGLEDHLITSQGLLLLNLQMGGMLIGGILFGILGDRKGRLSVLFGSIFLYSVANILNGFVQNIEQYAVLRFIAGIGLAGELGAGITLVAEMMPKEKRGYGTTIISSVGISGALLAWWMASQFDWRVAYFAGGAMGLLLLLLRVGVLESGLFESIKKSSHSIKRGDFLSLFKDRSKIRRFVNGIAIGAPLWYVVGILITLSPEFSKALGGLEPVDAGRSVFYCYAGLVFGDIVAGLISQKLKSRKKVILMFLIATTVAMITFFRLQGLTADQFYLMTFILGFCVGYWVLFVTVAAEQFGTNLRATVATSTPNFVRGSLVVITLFFTEGIPHDRRNRKKSQVKKIEIKSPTRVDLAGGTLDLWPLNQFVQGATTLNVAIDVWTRAILEPQENKKIIWNSQDLNLTKTYQDLNEALHDPDPRVILFQSVIKFFKPEQGFILTTKSESPVGGGLGGSSSLTISMMKAFSQWSGQHFKTAHEMVNVAHNLEAFVLNTPTGTQDYYPAVSGGLNILKYNFSGIEQKIYDVQNSPLKDHFMLVYTGKSHHSGLNNFEVMKSAVQKEVKTMTALKDLKIIAEKMEKSILSQSWNDLPELFNQEFDARVRLAPAFTSPEIEQLNKITLEAGADAVKICGAGGGGCILVWCAPDNKPKVVSTCQKAGFQVMNAQPVNKLEEPLQKSF